jgi:myosin heavy subunit
MSKDLFDMKLVMKQLNALKVADTVILRAQGFPCRTLVEDFVRR